jgi:hypothetical protein
MRAQSNQYLGHRKTDSSTYHACVTSAYLVFQLLAVESFVNRDSKIRSATCTSCYPRPTIAGDTVETESVPVLPATLTRDEAAIDMDVLQMFLCLHGDLRLC